MDLLGFAGTTTEGGHTIPAQAKTANERMIERIDAALNIIPAPDPVEGEHDDARVLGYIREQITPQGIAKRDEHSGGVTHLHEVAEQRLKPYEKSTPTTQEVDPA